MNKPSNITCPNCGHGFELSDALTHQIRDHLRAELQVDITRREAEAKRKLDEAKAREDKLNEEIEKQLKVKLPEAQAKAAKQVEGKFMEQLKEMQQSIHDKDASIKTFRDNELKLRKEREALQREKEDFDLKLQRTLDNERALIRKEAECRILEQQQQKVKEKDLSIERLKQELADMKRRLEQGSMELQGEAFEQNFETQVKQTFVHDEIAPVPKGIKGADLIHSVRTSSGSECGILLWETKNTKSWSGQWVAKLKEDMIQTRASLAIIVTIALPDTIKRFDLIEGVWVTDPHCAIPLAAALRQQLIAVNCERQSSVGKNDKMEMLYQYLAGTQFKQRIEGIVEAFKEMRVSLDKERRAMEKQWAAREKQIERVIRNTVGLHGDMQGIIGSHVVEIPALELGCEEVKILPEQT